MRRGKEKSKGKERIVEKQISKAESERLILEKESVGQGDKEKAKRKKGAEGREKKLKE